MKSLLTNMLTLTLTLFKINEFFGTIRILKFLSPKNLIECSKWSEHILWSLSYSRSSESLETVGLSNGLRSWGPPTCENSVGTERVLAARSEAWLTGENLPLMSKSWSREGRGNEQEDDSKSLEHFPEKYLLLNFLTLHSNSSTSCDRVNQLVLTNHYIFAQLSAR